MKTLQHNGFFNRLMGANLPPLPFGFKFLMRIGGRIMSVKDLLKKRMSILPGLEDTILFGHNLPVRSTTSKPAFDAIHRVQGVISADAVFS